MAIAFRSANEAGSTGTTSAAFTIPADVQTGDILIVAVTNRDATDDPSVTDNDTGGNVWAKIANQNAATNGAGTVWWKRATSASASKTITVSGTTGSVAAGVAAFSGCLTSGDPYAQVSGESNSSGNETHATSFYLIDAAAWPVFAIFNTSDDIVDVASVAFNPVSGTATTLTERILARSTGGNDCAVTLDSAALNGGINRLFSTVTWSQTNGVGASIFFALLPEPNTSNAIYRVAQSGASAGSETTSFSCLIPSIVATDDILVLSCVNRDGTTDPAVVDDDVTGNLWALLGGQNADTNGELTVWWKRATAATASKTISATLFTGSCSGVLNVYRGCETTGNPYENVTGETNASANETQAGFTPTLNGSMVCLAVAQTSNDTLNVSTMACTDPGTLVGLVRGVSTGGSDCAVDFASAYQASAGVTGSFTWAQTNGTGASIAFDLVPENEPADASVGRGLITSILLERRRLAA